MGSVKDLEIIKEPREKEKGIGRFHFSDRYSVFDWGEMPDQIKDKGKSLCVMGAFFFEKLEEKGINTHYRGVINKEGKSCSLEKIEHPPETMEVDLVRVIEPRYKQFKYDYSQFKELKESDEGNFLIPLEIIYRNGLPKGSSVFRRLRNNKMSLDDFGLEKEPEPGQDLEKPIFDVSTKLEKKDRYVKWSEAKEIAGLNDSEVNQIKNTLNVINKTITEETKKADLKNEDGKIELAFDEKRNIMVVDVVGTLDECRFTYNGIQVSKEIAREYYKNTEWEKEVKKAQKESKEKNEKDWKKFCSKKPEKMDEELKKIISRLYKSAANQVTETDLFETPPLSEVIRSLKKYRG